jgi:hypothetical protein
LWVFRDFDGGKDSQVHRAGRWCFLENQTAREEFSTLAPDHNAISFFGEKIHNEQKKILSSF